MKFYKYLFLFIILISFHFTDAQNLEIKTVMDFTIKFLEDITNNKFNEILNLIDSTKISKDTLFLISNRFNELINHERNRNGYNYEEICWYGEKSGWCNEVTIRVDHEYVNNAYYLYFLKLFVKIDQEKIIISDISLSDGSYFGEKGPDIKDKTNLIDVELIDEESFSMIFESNGKEYSTVTYFPYIDNITFEENILKLTYPKGKPSEYKINYSELDKKLKIIIDKFHEYKLNKSIRKI